MSERITLLPALMGPGFTAPSVTVENKVPPLRPALVARVGAPIPVRSVLDPGARAIRSGGHATLASPRILGSVWIATDFSPDAELLLSRAAHLPLRKDALLTLVHVSDGPARNGLAAKLRAQMSSLRERLKAAGVRGPRVRGRLQRGIPARRLAEAVTKEHADLLLIGRHGQRRFKDLVVGSTAERAVRLTQTPVLVVHTEARHPYQRPIAGWDPSACSQSAFAMALKLAPAPTALTAVHAYDPELLRRTRPRRSDSQLREEAFALGKRRWIRFCKAVGHPPVPMVMRLGDAREALLEEARIAHADLVAVGTHARTGVDRWLLGSVAEATLRNAECDVLVVRAP